MSVNNRWIDATDNPRSAATACVARESNWKGGRKCPDKFLQSTHIGAQLLFSLFLRSTFVRLLVGKAKCTFPARAGSGTPTLAANQSGSANAQTRDQGRDFQASL